MAAAVVVRRRNPSCVKREKAIAPASCSHQRRAATAWECSTVASASQTFTSGKLIAEEAMSGKLDSRKLNSRKVDESGKFDEIVNLFVRDLDMPAGRADERRVELQPALRPRRLVLLHCTLDAPKNQLSSRAAP